MKAFFHKWLRRLPKAESGFTLVELLVVVAIIIALAAVIIPSVASFADKGDEGAKAAEMENVQTAMDTYMADSGNAAVTANSSNHTNDMSGPPDLTTFMRNATTTYYYCWDTTGLVTSQADTAATC